MADPNDDELLSNLSDSSFVVLSQGSLSSHLNEESSVDFVARDLKDLATVENQTSACFEAKNWFDEQSQRKLNQLIEENYQLMETIIQNKLAMNSQLNKFFAWQKMVLQTQETHKQKFSETYDLILKLRTENDNLKKKLEDDSGNFFILNHIDSGSENLSHQAKISISEEIDNLKLEVNKFQEICRDLNIKSENLFSNYDISGKALIEARTAITQLNKELESLINESSDLKTKINEHPRSSIGSFSSLFNSDARMQISNLFEQLEVKRSKVSKLKEELEIQKSHCSVESESKLRTAEELTSYIENLDDMNKSFKDQIERFSIIMNWISIAEENCDSSEKSLKKDSTDVAILSEIEKLKKNLLLEGIFMVQKQENLQKMNEKFQKLLQEFRDPEEKLKSLEKVTYDVHKYKDQVENLTRQLEEKDDELSTLHEENEKMKEDIQRMNSSSDDIAVLRVQVQLYQSDFDDERAAREKVAGEKEELAEQVKLLEKKLQDLKTIHDTEKESSQSTSSPEKREMAQFTCPKCGCLFSDAEICKIHSDLCFQTCRIF